MSFRDIAAEQRELIKAEVASFPKPDDQGTAAILSIAPPKDASEAA